MLCVLETDTISFMTFLLYRHLLKDSLPQKAINAFLYKRYRNTRDHGGMFSQ